LGASKRSIEKDNDVVIPPPKADKDIVFFEKMTIRQARKILGKLAINLSDEELKKEIGNAMFNAEIFWQNYQYFLKGSKVGKK